MSLRLRLLVAAALLAMALTGIGFWLISTVERSQVRQIDSQLRATVPIAARLGRDFTPPNAAPPITGPSGIDTRVREFSDNYVAVVTASARQVLAVPQSAKGQQPSTPAQVSTSPSSLRPQTVGSVTGSTQWRAVLLRTPSGREVLVAIDIASIDATASDLRDAILGAGLAVAAILLASGFWVERLGLRPLAQMEEVAEAIIAGDRSRRASESPPRAEAARLARAFNLMLDQQNAVEDQLRQFVSDASHELRTPTAVITGVTDLWREGQLRDGPPLDDAMRRIGQAALRMRSLVEELLLLARLDEGRQPDHEHVHVAELLRSIRSDLESVHPSRLIEVDVEESLVVQADPVGLRKAVSNLVTNAVVHTPSGSNVTVRAGREAETVTVEVADDGPGMEPSDADRAFDRFWRGSASRTRPGTGLGLPIVAAVVKAHGGTVALDTSAAAGTRVRLVIPAGAPERYELEPSAKPPSAKPRFGESPSGA